MTSHMHHSERGSAICDCLVTGSVMTSHMHHSERGSAICDCLLYFTLVGVVTYDVSRPAAQLLLHHPSSAILMFSSNGNKIMNHPLHVLSVKDEYDALCRHVGYPPTLW